MPTPWLQIPAQLRFVISIALVMFNKQRCSLQFDDHDFLRHQAMQDRASGSSQKPLNLRLETSLRKLGFDTLRVLSITGSLCLLANGANAESASSQTLKSPKISPSIATPQTQLNPTEIESPPLDKNLKKHHFTVEEESLSPLAQQAPIEPERPQLPEVTPTPLPPLEQLFQPNLTESLVEEESLSPLAQQAPIEPERPQLPEVTPTPLPPPEQLLQPNTPETLPGEEFLETIPGQIFVERYEVLGSTVFTQEEFDEVLQDFVGQEISFAEILQARSAVTKLYTDNGYITSGALIPPQTLETGVLQIQVIEGALEDILVTVDGRLNSGYVRSRLELATKPPLNVDRLLEALQLLQLNPIVENLSAELSAGSRPGLNLLEVAVTEADTFSIEIFGDNGRSPSVGSFRRGIEVRELDFFGLGDRISLAYKNTDGSHEGEARYSLPVNASNGTVDLRFRIVSSEIVEEPFDRLDIEADSRDFELSFRQPLLETPTQQFALGLTATRRESDTSLLGVDFPLSLGANEDGETRLSILRFFQEYTERGPRQVFAARSQFSLGIDAFDATVNGIRPDSRFFTWRGQLQYLRLLSESESAPSLLLRSDMQLAATSLVPLEQFGLGGFESIRGYRQDEVLTDNGLFASAEVRIPLLQTGDGEGRLQLSPFFDVGTGWNNDGRANPDPKTLMSIGLGLAWLQGDDFSARVDWGIRLLDDSLDDRDTLQENGVYFSVRWTPF